jgi:hypothetical protein
MALGEWSRIAPVSRRRTSPDVPEIHPGGGLRAIDWKSICCMETHAKLTSAIDPALRPRRPCSSHRQTGVGPLDRPRAEDHRFVARAIQLRPDADVALADRERGTVRWFTFAGGIINTALADTIRSAGADGATVDDFWVRVAGTTDVRGVIQTIHSRSAGEIRDRFQISEEFLEKLKFNECLPETLAHDLLRQRLLDLDEIEQTTSSDVEKVEG